MKENDLCHALFDALRRDYVDFVKLLIDFGASLEKLTLNNLEQLYASADVRIVRKLHSYSARFFSIYFLNRLIVAYPCDRSVAKVFRQEMTTIHRIFPNYLWYVFITNFVRE